MRSLFVILDRSVVGELIRTDGGEHRFSYVGARTAPISLSMPVDGGQFRHRVVDPFLEGLLPDQAPVREALAARYGVSPRNPFALLEHIGLDCAGAVRFADAEHLTRALDDDGELVALSEEEIGARLAALEEGREPSWIAPGEGWSLAGAQTKIALRREGGQWYEARGCEPTTHILKPGITRMKEQALDEHLCLTTLREIGIPAARTRYARLGGREALIVERYDRLREGGRVRRVHQEDLCQATSTYPRRKYEADGGPGALRIIDLLARWGDRDGASIRRFVDALIVNVLLGAPDAHAKNYSILHAGDRRLLAPLYDLASGLPYARSGAPLGPPGGRGALADLRHEHRRRARARPHRGRSMGAPGRGRPARFAGPHAGGRRRRPSRAARRPPARRPGHRHRPRARRQPRPGGQAAARPPARRRRPALRRGPRPAAVSGSRPAAAPAHSVRRGWGSRGPSRWPDRGFARDGAGTSGRAPPPGADGDRMGIAVGRPTVG